jgi:preprotein translocase SecF subunit
MPQFLIGTAVRWMGLRKFAYLFSGSAIAIGIISIFAHGGLRLGIDFSGGRLIQIATNQRIAVSEVRRITDQIGFSGAEIQEIGHEGRQFQIRIAQAEAEAHGEEGIKSPSETIAASLEKEHAGLGVEVRREETVGPKIGQELRGKAIWAILWSMAGILLYVGIRYEFKFALGAVIAIFHDVFFTITIFSLLNKEFSIPIVAALLTIAGYSVNDTIVIFDRIREQRPLHRRDPLSSVIDLSVNQTLSRTIITVATVLCTVYALFFLGGEVLHDFALAMLIGVGIGTYSSVFVAGALALDITRWFEQRKAPAVAAAR